MSVQPNIPEYRAYPRAPITEAVIDVMFTPAVDEKIRKAVRTKLDTHYPLSEIWREVSLNVSIDGDTGSAAMQPQVQGWKLTTMDQLDIAVIADVRFMVSRLAPYTGWEALVDRTKTAWKVFRRLANYRKLTRVGVRYINRIDVPTLDDGATVDLADYLHIRPNTHFSSLPPMNRYLMQTAFKLDTCHVIINTASVPSPLIGYASFALDIDLIRDYEVPQADDDLWAYLSEVRRIKNSIFESCVTDKARALFEK